MFLNILEPPRMPIGAATTSQTTNAKCCHCCASYGTTTINMTCDKNFVLNGDTIQVNGVIDHSRGTEDIKTCRIMLEERRVVISSGGHTRHHVDRSWAMHGINNQISKGGTQNFQFTNTIPNEITSYTAIGRVTARYFVLHLYTEYGCCANTAYA